MTTRDAPFQQEHRWPGIRILSISLGFLLLLGLSVAGAVIIELNHGSALGREDILAYVGRVGGELVLLNAALLFLLALGPYAIFNSFGASYLALGFAVMTAAYANSQKITLRGEPLYPADIGFLRDTAFLLDNLNISLGLAALFTMAAGAVIATIWWAIRRMIDPRTGWRESPLSRRHIGLRIIAALACSTAVLLTSAIHAPNSLVNRLYANAGADWVQWSQYENYASNGFVAGFLYNLPGPVMEPFPGYSRALVEEALDRWESKAQTLNQDRNPDVLDTLNVVVILGESFADPTRWSGLEFAEDPMPFTRDLMTRTIAGTMLSPAYGGGTANVEWEVLTGFPVREFAPQMRTPFQQVVQHRATYPSHLTRLTEGAGLETLGLHPWMSNFYQRASVYPALGIEKSLFINDFAADKIEANPYVPDRVVFDTAIREIATSDAPLAINLVTMQNHNPYSGWYSNPIATSGLSDEDKLTELGHFARGISHADTALEAFLTELSRLDEPSLVIYYGDHLPGIVPDETLGRMAPQARFETPYFVWSTEELRSVASPPMIGANLLVTTAIEAVGAPLTTLDALLTEVRWVSPARTPEFLLNSDGKAVTSLDLTPEEEQVMNDYLLFQYDIAAGRGYSAERLYAAPMP